MIAFLRGTVLEKGPDSVVLEAGGVGYEVHLTQSAAAALPPEGAAAELFINESTGIYGGAVTLYGFPTREDRELFLSIKDNVPSTGAKKALEHLDKASRSLPEFLKAVREQDPARLCAVLGFTRKTAEKLLAGLKGKLEGSLPCARPSPADAVRTGPLSRAAEALASLGYKPAEWRAALEAVSRDLENREAGVEELVRRALRRL